MWAENVMSKYVFSVHPCFFSRNSSTKNMCCYGVEDPFFQFKDYNLILPANKTFYYTFNYVEAILLTFKCR